MNILLAIAHYTHASGAAAAEPLIRCIVGWRGLAESGVQDFGGPCQATRAHQIDVLVVDDGTHSAMAFVPEGLAERAMVDGDPLRLPLACRALMDGQRARYDLLCYSEHDNWPTAPDFFARIAAAQTAEPLTVLIPHRYERVCAAPYKVYIDGDNGWGAYGALWAVTRAQWEFWRTMPHFLEYTDQFAGSLESGCAWSLLQTFTCRKDAAFESEHGGDRYARRSISRGIVWA